MQTTHWNCKDRATNKNISAEELRLGEATAIHICEKCAAKFEEDGEIGEVYRDESGEHMCLKNVIAKEILKH